LRKGSILRFREIAVVMRVEMDSEEFCKICQQEVMRMNQYYLSFDALYRISVDDSELLNDFAITLDRINKPTIKQGGSLKAEEIGHVFDALGEWMFEKKLKLYNDDYISSPFFRKLEKQVNSFQETRKFMIAVNAFEKKKTTEHDVVVVFDEFDEPETPLSLSLVNVEIMNLEKDEKELPFDAKATLQQEQAQTSISFNGAENSI